MSSLGDSEKAEPGVWARRKNPVIAATAIVGIFLHLILRFGVRSQPVFGLGVELETLPLLLTILVGGSTQIIELMGKALRREFGSDLLAGLSIVTAVLLGEYLAGSLVVLMLSGGQSLEAYAVRSASSVLNALARRMPSVAHRRTDGQVVEVQLADIAIGDLLVVFPHETCPVDATVVEGHGVMDESYLTGEPYRISKAPGSSVLSPAQSMVSRHS